MLTVIHKQLSVGGKIYLFYLFFSELSVICNYKHNIHNFKFDKICISKQEENKPAIRQDLQTLEKML